MGKCKREETKVSSPNQHLTEYDFRMEKRLARKYLR